jgi:hypothetical protein
VSLENAFAAFTFNFTDPTNGVTYPTTMVGNDPNSGRPSVMKSLIIPLKMQFVAGGQDTSALNDLGYVGFTAPPLNHTFDGSRRVNDVLNSPLYKSFAQPAAWAATTRSTEMLSCAPSSARSTPATTSSPRTWASRRPRR